jgi:hypothetical protein
VIYIDMVWTEVQYIGACRGSSMEG